MARTGRALWLAIGLLTIGSPTRGANLPSAPPGERVSVDDGAWVLFPPPSRVDLAVHDTVGDRLIVIAWRGGSSLTELWTFDPGDSAWHQLTASGTVPPPRPGSTATFDPLHRRVLVFGGSATNELWSLSLEGTPTWSRLFPSGTLPHGRNDHAAIYDPVRDQLLVFGGAYSGPGLVRLGDVWVLSLSGTLAWSAISTSGTAPSPRTGAAAVYDSIGDRMVVYGGADPAPSNDVWALDLAGAPTWSRWNTEGALPPGDVRPMAVLDASGRLVVCAQDRIWTRELSPTATWSMRSIEGAFPISPDFKACVVDRSSNRFLLLGDEDGGGIALEGEPTWVSLFSTRSIDPMQYHCVVYDPVRDRMIAIGSGRLTWARSLQGEGSWSPIVSQVQLEDRTGCAAIYDPRRDRVVLFGGGLGGFQYNNDVWALSLGSAVREWTELQPVGIPPSARARSTAIYDPVGDRMILFGGGDASAMSNEVWALSLGESPIWTRLSTSGTPPEERERHAAVYEPRSHAMLIFGKASGSYLGGRSLSDVWTLDLRPDLVTHSWRQLTPGDPPPRGGSSVVLDPVRNRLVLWGGVYIARSSPNRYLTDAWSLSLASTPTWSRLNPSGPSPFPRHGSPAIYDPLRDRMLFFSGDSLSDLWALEWGHPTPIEVSCFDRGSDLPGDSIRVFHRVTNPYAFAQPCTMVVRSARNWPGFPLTHAQTIPAGASDTLEFHAMIPDTAAAGPNPLEITVTSMAVPMTVRCAQSVLTRSVSVRIGRITAEASRVVIEWQADERAGLQVRVYRREAESESWTSLETLVSDAAGRLTFEDEAVTPGRRYGYRVGLLTDEREFLSEETWIDVPAQTLLSLAGFLPNPAGGRLQLAFTLADPSPARLEVIDLAGRHVMDRRLEGLAPGRHVLDDATIGPLRSGMYVLRLTQSGRSVTTRGVVIR